MGLIQLLSFVCSFLVLVLAGFGLTNLLRRLKLGEFDFRFCSGILLVNLGVAIAALYQFGLPLLSVAWVIIASLVFFCILGIQEIRNSEIDFKKTASWLLISITVTSIPFLVTTYGNLGYWNPDGFNYSWMAKMSQRYGHRELLEAGKNYLAREAENTEKTTEICKTGEANLHRLKVSPELRDAHLRQCILYSGPFLYNLTNVYANYRNGMTPIHGVISKILFLDPLFSTQVIAALFSAATFLVLSTLAGTFIFPALLGLFSISITLPVFLQWQSHSMSLLALALLLAAYLNQNRILRPWLIISSLAFLIYVFPEASPFALASITPLVVNRAFWQGNLRQISVIALIFALSTFPTVQSSLKSLGRHFTDSSSAAQANASSNGLAKFRSGQGVFDFMDLPNSVMTIFGGIHPAPAKVLDLKIPIAYKLLVPAVAFFLFGLNFSNSFKKNRLLVTGITFTFLMSSAGTIFALMILDDQYIAFKFALFANFYIAAGLIFFMTNGTSSKIKFGLGISYLVFAAAPTILGLYSFARLYDGTFNPSPLLRYFDVAKISEEIKSAHDKVLVTSDQTAFLIFTSYLLTDLDNPKLEVYYPNFSGKLVRTNLYFSNPLKSWFCSDFTDYYHIGIRAFGRSTEDEPIFHFDKPGTKKYWTVFDLGLADRENHWPELVNTVSPPDEYFSDNFSFCK